MKPNKVVLICLLIALLAVLVAAVTVGKSNRQTSPLSPTKKLQVVTTLFPLYDFARTIGQDKVAVSLLLPPGVEAHSFEPKPQDVVRINQADVFIYTGKFMEPWAEDIIKGVTNTRLSVVNAGTGIKMISGVFHDADEPVGTMDPHIWLDFDNDQMMVNTITQAFVDRDPANRFFYEQRDADFNHQLSSLDEEYRSALATCKTKEIIYGGHYAFGYLANRYGLHYLAAQGVSPDAEPTANDLVNLVAQIKRDHIPYVFYEELTSPKIAQTLAQETGAHMLLLNAAHNLSKDQLDQGLSYLSIMQSNLVNLKIGLDCK